MQAEPCRCFVYQNPTHFVNKIKGKKLSILPSTFNMVDMTSKIQSDRAYHEIRHRLMANSIDPGERLVEQAWAEKLQVNRGDIRQALARLLAEGAVTRGARGGFFAREYSAEDIRENNELRIILETAAARMAAQQITPEELDELDEICIHLLMMAENDYEMGFAEVDVRFHRAVVKAAHNSALTHTYMHANIPIAKSPVAPPGTMRERYIADAEEHRQIAQALREKDGQKAARLITEGMTPRSESNAR